MNDELREQISALVDGELASDQARFLLRRIDANAALAHCWSRYQMAGAVMRRESAACLPLRADFAQGVLLAVTADARRQTGMRVLRWAGGGAIAAAVAVFALVANQPVLHAPTPSATLAAVPSATVPASRAEVFMPIAPSFDYAQPASFDSGVLNLPRYDLHAQYAPVVHANVQAPYVLLLAPEQPGTRASPPVQRQ